MSLFGTLLSKIFPSSHPAVAASAGAAPTATTAGAPAGAAASAGGATGGTAAGPPVDVEKILDDMAAKNPEKLNWRTSIVDLMKLVGMDSSLANRKALAQELHYTGDSNDSAAMNIWLHKQVMTRMAQNGGKVPADLKD